MCLLPSTSSLLPTQGPLRSPVGPCPCRVLGSVAKTTSARMGDDSKGQTWAVLSVQGV